MSNIKKISVLAILLTMLCGFTTKDLNYINFVDPHLGKSIMYIPEDVVQYLNIEDDYIYFTCNAPVICRIEYGVEDTYTDCIFEGFNKGYFVVENVKYVLEPSEIATHISYFDRDKLLISGMFLGGALLLCLLFKR